MISPGGILYVSNFSFLCCAGNNVVSVDPRVLPFGTSTIISDQGGGLNWHGLASNESTGELYTIDKGSFGDRNSFKTLTLDGTISDIGNNNTVINGPGMAYDDANSILYATHQPCGSCIAELYTVDTTLGTSTLIGPTGILNSGRHGLAFDENLGVLYFVTDVLDPDTGLLNAKLWSLDVSSGNATLIGPTGLPNLEGLAWIFDTDDDNDTAIKPMPLLQLLLDD